MRPNAFTVRVPMSQRRKPPQRVKPTRSRNNRKRRLREPIPTVAEREALSASAKYGPHSKHKYNPSAYGLTPYSGQDEDRTYCDAHANFGKHDFSRIPTLLKRGILLGLWSDGAGPPDMLWTIDDNGWIYEMPVTNIVQHDYHGYPLLPGDAFVAQLLARSRAFDPAGFTVQIDPDIHAAIAAAEAHYR
jgi:hypothetical protein